MSATPAPPPVPPPHPPHPRPGAQPTGCLPFMVFILAVACGAGFLSLWCGCLPKEDAGQTVIEILDSPSPAEMKAHVIRITSGEVLSLAARNAGGNMPDKVRGEVQDRLRRNVEVSADGPFITITAYDERQSPVEMAHMLETAYQEDLISETVNPRRRVSQSRHAHITLTESSAEKARLEWLDIMKKHGFTPDGSSPVDAAATKEIAARLAKTKLDLAMTEQRVAALQDNDFEKALAAADALPKGGLRGVLSDYIKLKKAAAAPNAGPADASNLKGTRESLAEDLANLVNTAQSNARHYSTEIRTLESALKEHEQSLRDHQQRRSEPDAAKARYDSQLKLLNKLREASLEQNVADSVVIRPVRVVDEARPVKVPDRRIRKYVEYAIRAGAVLAAAFLLCALAGRLCRRGP